MSLLNESHKELIEAAKSGELVIFAGAGISKSLGFPLWNELIEKIIEHISTQHNEHGDILHRLLNNQTSDRKIFDCLSYIENHNLKGYANHVLTDEIFNKGRNIIEGKQPLTLQSKLWQLSKKIVTPNYDCLLESCDEFRNLNLQPISNKSILSLAMISKIRHYLLKIHGSIDEIDQIIFYESQYKNQYEQNTPVKEKFRELIANSPILFIGTSMTDPYINKIISDVNSIFHNTSAKNFILTNDAFGSPDVIKIKGSSTHQLDQLIEELLKIKGEEAIIQGQNPSQLPKRLKTIETAIKEINELSAIFPSWSDFENDQIHLSQAIYSYIKNRFEKHIGPVLCQGRWSTGKTVSILKVGLELIKDGFTCYYLDLINDIAGHEETILKEYLHKILEKYNNEKTVFIIDNIHLFPEYAYKFCQWAITKKSNCIFVGRPLSLEFKERQFYYPQLFEQLQSHNNNEDDEDFFEEHIFEGDLETYSAKINFKPSAEYVKSIFDNRLSSIGRSDITKIEDIEKFAASISYNLSFIAFHVKNIGLKTANIYQIDYRLLYDFINDQFYLSEFPNELFTIAALSFLDCKCDSKAIFLQDSIRKIKFRQKQVHLTERREFLYGMHSAMGNLILDLGINQNLIRFDDNSICYDFHSALKHLIEKYLQNKPSNVYEVFFGLSNYEFEAAELSNDNTIEEARELVRYCLTRPNLVTHYADIIVHRTNSLLKFGFLVKIFLQHRVEPDILQKVFNQDIITKLSATYIEFKKKRSGGRFFVSWPLKYAWVMLRKIDKDLANFFLSQFPEEVILSYASLTLGTFSAFLEIASHNSHIDELLFINRGTVMGDKETFTRKIKATTELKLFFFLRNSHKLFLGKYKNNDLISLIKTHISPEDYCEIIKSFSKISLLSFVSARRVLGQNYFHTLQNSFDKDFVYKLFYDKPLFKINMILSESSWRKFVKDDLQNKLNESYVDEISTFFRNISLHGAAKNFVDDLVDKLFEERIINQLIGKILNTDDEKNFGFFWQVKTLDETLFNKYFNEYVSRADAEFEPIRIEKTRIAFSFLLLIYCYSNDVNSKSLLDSKEIELHVRRAVISNTLSDKIFINSLAGIFDLSIKVAYNFETEHFKGIHFTEQLFESLEGERTHFDVYNELIFWWESKILMFTATLIGINRMDNTILKDSRFNKSIKSLRYDLKLISDNIENRLPSNLKASEDTLILFNRISILKLVKQILE